MTGDKNGLYETANGVQFETKGAAAAYGRWKAAAEAEMAPGPLGSFDDQMVLLFDAWYTCSNQGLLHPESRLPYSPERPDPIEDAHTERLRKRALRMAVLTSHGEEWSASQVVARAEAYFRFLKGESEG